MRKRIDIPIIEVYSGYWFGPLNQPDHPEYMIYSK